MRPAVSVIIPCYNLGRYLDEAVESVLSQSFQDFEIIVVDDGSSDEETCQLLSHYSKPRTQVLRSENRGLSAARNLGILHSRGEYVCTLDADDCLEQSWLERGVEVLSTDASVAFVSHWFDAFGDEEWQWTPVRCDLAILLDVNTVNGAAIIRRDVVREVGGFDESMREGCEDWEFWIRVTERGFRGVIIPEALYRYRRRAESMSRAMHRNDVHLGIYADVVAKHPESYRRHLLDLILRREQTFSDLCHRVRVLEEELATWLEPALVQRRREIERARSRLAEIRARENAVRDRRNLAHQIDHLEWRVAEETRRADWLARERARLLGLVNELEKGSGDHEGRLTDYESRRRALQAECDGLSQRIQDLYRSKSWRITGPLRRIAEWLGWAGKHR